MPTSTTWSMWCTNSPPRGALVSGQGEAGDQTPHGLGQTRSRLTPSWVFPQLLILLAALTLAGAWVLHNYYGQSTAETFSAGSADGWCDSASEGLGVHCFGDFHLPRLLAANLAETWSSDQFAHPYTPTSMVPHIASRYAAETPLGVRGSLFLYLVLLGIALLVPAAACAWKATPRRLALLPLLLVGLATQPFLASIDRGNSVAFAVPAVFIFALSVKRKPSWLAPSAVVLAACIRPQFILLALAFVAFRQWRALLYSVGAGLASQLLLFVVWPGGFVHAVSGWLSNVSAFRVPVDIVATSNANVSSARGVVYFGRLLEQGPGFVGSAGSGLIRWVAANPGAPGIAIGAGALFAVIALQKHLPRAAMLFIILPLPALVPSVSFGYYTVFALVLGALIWGPSLLTRTAGRWSLRNEGLLDQLPGRLWRSWAWFALGAVALTLFPLPFRFAGGWNSGFLEITGLTWTLVVVGTIAVGCVSWATGRSSRSMR